MSAIDPAIVQAVLALTDGSSESTVTSGDARSDVACARSGGVAVHRPGRFLTLAQVAEELAVSESTVTALIKRGRLQALKIGGRHWRVERAKLEEFIAASYADVPVESDSA